MYEQFYGLRDKPFSLTPNPRFVFYSKQYHEAEGQLIYGINNREGFMLVTGQPGTGKTTLCRDLIEKLDREKSASALIFNPFLNGMEMLAALLTEFGINVPDGGTRKELLDRLNQFLLAQLALGKSCVAIFDEAQHLAPQFLEQIRVLSNLETVQEKLIQIVLVGQPELLDRIGTPEMAQLDQRVSIRCTLGDLDLEETDRYIHHRLNVAGARGQVHFSPRAVKEIFRGSHGVPRLINLVCDRALLAGYAAQTREIQPEHVRKAIAALRGEDTEVGDTDAVSTRLSTPRGTRRWTRRVAAIAAVIVVAAVTAGVAFWPRRGGVLSREDASYWQSTKEPSATDAERGLRAFVLAYPKSKHLDDVLLRLAQLELSRGDRASAILHLDRLAQHAPSGLNHTSAVVLLVLAHLDGGDTTLACRGISPDLAHAAAADPVLAQRLTSLSSVCAERAVPMSEGQPADSVGVAVVRRDSAARRPAKRGGSKAVATRDSVKLALAASGWGRPAAGTRQ